MIGLGVGIRAQMASQCIEIDVRALGGPVGHCAVAVGPCMMHMVGRNRPIGLDGSDRCRTFAIG